MVPLDFESGACKKYHKEVRLVSVQTFVEGGKRSIVFVAFDGRAGAGWESDKKDAVNRMLRDLSSEMAGRGGMLIIVTGDFNIQVDESTVIREMLRSGGWVDAHAFADADSRDKPTCIKRQGSRIDLCLANRAAACLLSSYEVRDGFLDKDHRRVCVTMRLPRAHTCPTTPQDRQESR